MRQLFFVLFIVFAFASCNEDKPEEHQIKFDVPVFVETVSGEYQIKFDTVEVYYLKGNTATQHEEIRVVISSWNSTDSLKSKIEKLYKDKVLTINGKKIVWEDGYPMWLPYGTNYSYRNNLFFGYLCDNKKGNDTLFVKGNKDRPIGYYPYKF